MSSLSSPLASIRDELDGTTRRLRALTASLDDAAWRRKPADKRWSVAECIEHLNLTSRAYLPLLRDAVRGGRERGLTNPGGSCRLDFIGWMLVKSIEPPVKRRGQMKTPPPFVPRSIEPMMKVIHEYEELQRELIDLLTQMDGLAISKIKVTSAFNAKLRYSTYSSLRVIASHQRRHLWQAEQVLAENRATSR